MNGKSERDTRWGRGYDGEPTLLYGLLRYAVHGAAAVIRWLGLILSLALVSVFLGLLGRPGHVDVFVAATLLVITGLAIPSCIFLLRAGRAFRAAQDDLYAMRDATLPVRRWARDFEQWMRSDADDNDGEAAAPASPSTATIVEALGRLELWRARWLGSMLLAPDLECPVGREADHIGRELQAALRYRSEALGFDPVGEDQRGWSWNGPERHRPLNMRRASE